MKHVEIYVGSVCSGNPGAGGWAAVLRMGRHDKALSGAEAPATLNRMDLSALVGALRIMVEPCALSVHASSRFLGEGYARWAGIWTPTGWSSIGKRPVRNGELWHTMFALAQPHQLMFAPPEDGGGPDMAQALRLAGEAAAERDT